MLTRMAAALVLFAGMLPAQEFRPEIPKAWDNKEVERFEVPLAQRDRSPRYMSSEEYYNLKVRPIYRTYPMYAKGVEPAGYLDWLKQQEPEIIFDPAKLHTKEDWIAAGKIVFEADIQFSPAREPPAAADVRWPLGNNGELTPYRGGYRYIIRKKGVLEGGANACANCHVRVLPDGSYLEGAQGVPNAPVTEAPLEARLERLRALTPEALSQTLNTMWVLFGAPWVMSRSEFEAYYTKDRLIREAPASHPSVLGRQGTSASHPPHVPSLIGIQDRKYLDSTGLVRNRSIGDLMRYAITNQGLDTLAYYGDFQPSPERTPFSGEEGTRYSDEQLYALALYLESLKPPPNPNPFDDRARRGERIFRQQGCAGCHTPPLYTNNKLTPAKGFQVPEDLRKTDDILDVSVGTDPTLALKTRRGTGFYKVPSLQGVWYRSAFGHAGQADTLEEWLDPARLRTDYVPKGFHAGPGPIVGHEFGLNLAPADKEALIAFLKTL
jgi:hypothetical protein